MVLMVACESQGLIHIFRHPKVTKKILHCLGFNGILARRLRYGGYYEAPTTRQRDNGGNDVTYPPKTKITSENVWLEDESFLGHIFRGELLLVLEECLIHAFNSLKNEGSSEIFSISKCSSPYISRKQIFFEG